MSKIEFVILSILSSRAATGKMVGMTVQDIQAADDIFCYKSNVYYKQLKALEQLGMVDVGSKQARAMTFYITKTGLEKLKEEKEHEG